MFRAAEAQPGKARAILKALAGVDAEHGFAQVGVQLVESWLAQAGRAARDQAADYTADGIAVLAYGFD